ncbi:DUF4192 family protein [Oerskovia paurometabola]|uniref:DUF4192 family protein n=1 Tax=Oerskovia paurometabola TaxID=162170 RepID=UPI003802E93B
MTDQNIVRAQSIADVLAEIPARLGFTPKDSAVVLCLRGTRAGLVARIDLTDLTAAAAGLLARHATRDRATAVVLVAYTDDVDQARQVVDVVTEAMHGQALDVCQAQQVTRSEYRDLFAGTPARPLSDLQSTVVAAEYVARGVAVAEDLAATLPQPAPQTAQDEARCAGDKHAQEAADDPSRFALATWRLATAGLVAGPDIYGHLARMLAHKPNRDAFLVCLTENPGSTAPEEVIKGAGEEAAARAALALAGDRDQAKAPGEDVEAAVHLLAQVVSHTPDSADAWAFWALLKWWQGKGPQARSAMERALDLDPHQNMARVLSMPITAGYGPAWTRLP